MNTYSQPPESLPTPEPDQHDQPTQPNQQDRVRVPALNGPVEDPSKPRSCADCYWSRDDATWCERYTKPLLHERLSSEESQLSLELQANECEEFIHQDVTVNRPPGRDIPLFTDMDAFFPILSPKDLRSRAGQAPDQRVKSCSQCIFYNHEAASQGLGFSPMNNLGACAATGRLLAHSTGHLRDVAKHCDKKLYGTSELSAYEYGIRAIMVPLLNKSHLQKELAARKSVGEDVTSESSMPWPVGYEPSTYEGDTPVTPEFQAQGVRAWLKVHDPEMTGNHVLVPVFSREYFSPEEQSKIPNTSDDERPGDYLDHQGVIYQMLVAWLELDETPALVGEPGTGKSEVLRTIAWMMGLPFERISITGSTELDDLQGKWVYRNNETSFQYGRLSAAWGKPNVICLDEPNTGPPEVWQFIRPLTDNSKQLVLDASKGERIMRSQNCFIGLAMNPAWDSRNIGAEFIADADSSRLLHIETHLPPWEVEQQILITRSKLDGWDVPEPILDLVKGVAEDLRDMSRNQEIPISWGIRSQIKVTRLLRWYPVVKAYEMAGIASLEPSVREVVIELIKSRTASTKSINKMREENARREEQAKKEAARLERAAQTTAQAPAPSPATGTSGQEGLNSESSTSQEAKSPSTLTGTASPTEPQSGSKSTSQPGYAPPPVLPPPLPPFPPKSPTSWEDLLKGGKK